MRSGAIPIFTAVYCGPVALYFSYQTCIAFIDSYGDCYHCAEQGKGPLAWSKTTKKHLASCPDAKMLLPYEEFQAHAASLLRPAVLPDDSKPSA